MEINPLEWNKIDKNKAIFTSDFSGLHAIVQFGCFEFRLDVRIESVQLSFLKKVIQLVRFIFRPPYLVA